MPITFVIYGIRNLVTKKLYIGQCVNQRDGVTGRWRQERNGHSGAPHLDNSFAKHGVDNFYWYIIEECPTFITSKEDKEEWCNEMEKFYIRKYGTTIRGRGYNLREGGSNSTHAPETISQISESLKGRRQTPEHVEARATALRDVPKTQEHRKAIRLSKLGKPSPKPEGFGETIRRALTGLNHTEERKKNISNALKEKYKKPVNQLDFDGNYIQTFSSIREAYESLGKELNSMIAGLCDGTRRGQSAYGFKWEWAT